MATGTLGQAALTAATNTTVYTVPADKYATFNVNLVNKGSSIGAVSIAISDTDTPTDSEYIEFNTPMDVSGVLERSGIVASANKRVVVNSTVDGVIVNVYGYEA